MLINDFFTLTKFSNSEGVLEAQVQLNAKHKIFDGHFPNNPITPGVVQVQIVKEILEKVLEKKCQLKEMGRCKFLAILNPNDNGIINLTIKHSTEDTFLKVSAQGTSDDNTTTFFKFTAKYA